MSRPIIFLFHRDLRTADNTTLIKAAKSTHKIIPLFIFNPAQIDPAQNPYFSSNAVQFMCECLTELNKQLFSHLLIRHGDPVSVLQSLYVEYNFRGVYSNKDTSPFALRTDGLLEKWCAANKVEWIQEEDYTLLPISVGLQGPNQCFTKFTPFYKKSESEPVPKPGVFQITRAHLFKKDAEPMNLAEFYTQNDNLASSRSELDGIMKNLVNLATTYDQTRDLIHVSGTSRLSPHLKFGSVSIRQVYHTVAAELGKDCGFIRQLYWREFFVKILHYMPQVLQGPMFDKYPGIPWSNNAQHWEAWTTGNTGFPIVDSAMRCLNATGYINNRMRLIVASFLIKNLLIDWRRGEKYFATKLVDYDPAQNNGGWQCIFGLIVGSSGSGTDNPPYFRIFNPWLQGEKWDPEAVFQKKWIPELGDVDAFTINQWHSSRIDSAYPRPIVDAHETAKRATSVFKSMSDE